MDIIKVMLDKAESHLSMYTIQTNKDKSYKFLLVFMTIAGLLSTALVLFFTPTFDWSQICFLRISTKGHISGTNGTVALSLTVRKAY